MPKRFAVLLAPAIVFAGCSRPTDRPLETGNHATLYAPNKANLYLTMNDGSLGIIPVGTHVEVVSAEETPTENEKEAKIRVNIREGEYAGKSTLVPRTQVRPAKD